MDADHLIDILSLMTERSLFNVLCKLLGMWLTFEGITTLLNTLTSKLCEIGEVSYLPSLEHYAE